MIIACPLDFTMQFYDATTLLPLKERETQKLYAPVMEMSFHLETDTYIIECINGSLYTYNASNQELKKLKVYGNETQAIAIVNPQYYAFASSKKLFLMNSENEDMVGFDSHTSAPSCLQHINKRDLLLSGLENGSVMIYRTDKVPHLQVFCSVRAHQDAVYPVQEMNVNGKEYIMTAGHDRSVKIWHLVKGRMRLLRVIYSEEYFSSVVYFENYKLIAIARKRSNEIKFLRFPSGKLESAVFVRKDDNIHGLFLMKEENMIGATSLKSDVIEFIQLGSAQEGI